MSNVKVIVDAIFSSLNDECKGSLTGSDGQIDYTSNAATAWADGVDSDGDLEVGSRYSKTGNPVVFRFEIENQAEIDEAIASDAENLPRPIYKA